MVLADEINRTTPKTQSALLEAMSESQVTEDNRPILCPIHSSLWRRKIRSSITEPIPCPNRSSIILMRIRIGYPSHASEKEIIHNGSSSSPARSITAAMDAADVLAIQESVKQIKVEESLLDYALEMSSAGAIPSS